jgi:hypothetical protein
MAVKWVATIASGSNGRDQGVRPVVSPCCKEDRKAPERDAERNRGHHEVRRPGDAAWKFQRQHSGVMHRYNAGTHNRTAEDSNPTRKIRQGNAQAGACNQSGDEQRQDCQSEIIACADTGIIREERDEMSRPDAEAGRRCVHAQPNEPPAPR